jgi:hypothetical protein
MHGLAAMAAVFWSHGETSIFWKLVQQWHVTLQNWPKYGFSKITKLLQLGFNYNHLILAINSLIIFARLRETPLQD